MQQRSTRGLRSPRRRPAGRGVLVVLALALLVLAPATGRAQGLRLFGDSPDRTFWDSSWGYANGGSSLELVNVTKFPVDTLHAFIGKNALRLAWTSAPGGDWALTAATQGWVAFDPTPCDSILFVVWSPAAIPASDLPDVFLEDQGNVRTPHHPLADWLPGVAAATWTRVAIPLAVFRANPGGADLTRINKIFFGQRAGSASGVARTLIVDEIRFIPTGTSAPAAPQVTATAFERHVEVRWDPALVPGAENLRIERYTGSEWVRVGDGRAEDGGFAHWIGAVSVSGTYRATALGWDLRASAPGPTVDAFTTDQTDEQWLDMAEEAAFRYFWLHAHPVSGLARERYGSGEVCATGGTGMGIMALIAGAERGYAPRAAVAGRVRGILAFFATKPVSYHGAFAHWVNGSSGASIPFDDPTDPAGDIVETSYLMQGLLAARQYFDGADTTETRIRELATQLWHAVDWDAYRPASPGNAVYWLWSPLTGFTKSFAVSGWNECMIVYLLAKASPTHPVPARCYAQGWARYGAMVNSGTFYGYRLWVGSDYGGSLFFSHYSFLGFDPRGRRDAWANYELHNHNHAHIQRAYCAANPYGRAGYGGDIWGLTASDDPWGYGAHAPYSNDNGTLTPSAALSSMPWTRAESLAALKALYRQYGRWIWGPFGFTDAFNPGMNWYASSYIAIDEGPIAVMIENARTGLLWDRFMRNPEIAPALDSLGFVPDQRLDAPGGAPAPAGIALAPPAPNPCRGAVSLAYEIPARSDVDLAVFDLQGRRVATLWSGVQEAGRHTARWEARDGRGPAVPSGVYFCRLKAGEQTATRRLLVLD